MPAAQKGPQSFKDVPATFCRANSTFAYLEHPDSVAGKPESFKIGDQVKSFIPKFEPETKVIISYVKDDWGGKVLTFIKRADSVGAPNEETGGQVPDTRTITPETPGVVVKSDWSIGGTLTIKDKLILIQTCTKVAGEVYAAVKPEGKTDNAPAVIAEWAIYLHRAALAEVARQ